MTLGPELYSLQSRSSRGAVNSINSSAQPSIVYPPITATVINPELHSDRFWLINLDSPVDVVPSEGLRVKLFKITRASPVDRTQLAPSYSISSCLGAFNWLVLETINLVTSDIDFFFTNSQCPNIVLILLISMMINMVSDTTWGPFTLARLSPVWFMGAHTGVLHASKHSILVPTSMSGQASQASS